MEARTRILIVDDDAGLTRSLGEFLELAGYQVAAAVNGQDALDRLGRFAPHLILLDIQMPFMDGCEFLRRLRRAGNWTPVIMLTIVTESGGKLLAFDEGADDYINKPFDYKELAARIRAVLRRVRPDQAPLVSASALTSGPLRLDRRSQKAYLDGRPLALTPKAVTVLEYLMLHRDEVIARERMLDILWDDRSFVNTRAVDIRIAELRRKLGDDARAPRFIATVSTMGYRFIGEVEAGV